MSQEPGKRYSDEELKEFETIILTQLASTQKELDKIKASLSGTNNNGTNATSGKVRGLEDGAYSLERENLSQQAARLQKFIANMENALVRIKNRTYGICRVTGNLISKERLRLVPHATLSMSAKLKQ